ncbi:MAG: cytidylyltransferase family protein [Acidilobaceae archaeon]|nr:cytidylyltransferase family protein [Acidilobaceae archaeon]
MPTSLFPTIERIRLFKCYSQARGGRGTFSRAARYIENVERALESLRVRGEREGPLLDAVRRYLSDGKHYLNAGDEVTALAIASYAEGLLDALRYLGLAEVEWPRGEIRRVFVGGTFDILHPGHIELLQFASRLGELHVVVARDATVERVKGRRPVLDESSRLKIVSSLRMVSRAMLGDPEDIMKSVEAVRPHVIVLGPDQPYEEEELARRAEERLGYRPEVIRFEGKREFGGGMRGSRDIVKAICSRCEGKRVEGD